MVVGAKVLNRVGKGRRLNPSKPSNNHLFAHSLVSFDETQGMDSLSNRNCKVTDDLISLRSVVRVYPSLPNNTLILNTYNFGLEGRPKISSSLWGFFVSKSWAKTRHQIFNGIDRITKEEVMSCVAVVVEKAASWLGEFFMDFSLLGFGKDASRGPGGEGTRGEAAKGCSPTLSDWRRQFHASIDKEGGEASESPTRKGVGYRGHLMSATTIISDPMGRGTGPS